MRLDIIQIKVASCLEQEGKLVESHVLCAYLQLNSLFRVKQAQRDAVAGERSSGENLPSLNTEDVANVTTNFSD